MCGPATALPINLVGKLITGEVDSQHQLTMSVECAADAANGARVLLAQYANELSSTIVDTANEPLRALASAKQIISAELITQRNPGVHDARVARTGGATGLDIARSRT